VDFVWKPGKSADSTWTSLELSNTSIPSIPANLKDRYKPKLIDLSKCGKVVKNLQTSSIVEKGNSKKITIT